MPFQLHQPLSRLVESLSSDDGPEVTLRFQIDDISSDLQGFHVKWLDKDINFFSNNELVSLKLPSCIPEFYLTYVSEFWTYTLNKFMAKLLYQSKHELVPISTFYRQKHNGPPSLWLSDPSEEDFKKTFECQAKFITIPPIVKQCMIDEPFYPNLVPTLRNPDGSSFPYIFTDFVFLELFDEKHANDIEKLRLDLDITHLQRGTYDRTWEFCSKLSGQDAILLEKSKQSWLFALSWTSEVESKHQIKEYLRYAINWCTRRCEEAWNPNDCLTQYSIVVSDDYGQRDRLLSFEFCWHEDDENQNDPSQIEPEPRVYVFSGLSNDLSYSAKFKSDLNLREFFGIT